MTWFERVGIFIVVVSASILTAIVTLCAWSVHPLAGIVVLGFGGGCIFYITKSYRS